jgi:hypothetical protein
MALNFDPRQSHRWAEHVHAWQDYLADGPPTYEKVMATYYLRDMLPKDENGRNYTPLMTSLMYGLGMDEKMETEVRAQRELFDIDLGMDIKILEDTDALMRLFLSDARELLKKTPYGLTAMDSDSPRYDDIVLGIPRGRELIDVFNMKNPDADSLIRLYVVSRLAQEYWTLNGAAASYHLIGRYGREAFSEALRENAEKIAWEITGKLAGVIRTARQAGVRDMGGMETDHVLSEAMLWRGPLTLEKHRVFHNCPIAGAYRKTDEVLGKKYGKTAFTEGTDFCGVCEEHGQQAVELFAPVFVKLEGREGKSISAGGGHCDFVSTTSFSNIPGGFARKIRARAMSGKASRR